MKGSAPSFSKAFGLSVAVHLAVFGSAFAFAYYNGPFFGAGFRTIMVSLVGPGNGTGDGPGNAGARRTMSTAVPLPAVPSPAKEEMAALQPSGAVPVQEAAARLQDIRTGEDAAGGDGTAAAGQMNGPSGGEEGAGLSAEHWNGLRAALERAKTYPRLARERGIEGTVLVRFHVLPSGDVDSVTVVRSSGAKVLDDASIRTVLKASPVPFGKGWIEVPMVYKLVDSNQAADGR